MTDTAATPKKRTAKYLEGRFQLRNDVIIIPSSVYLIFNGIILQSRKCQESVKISSKRRMINGFDALKNIDMISR